MTKTRLDGLYLLVLGSVAFLLLGTALATTSPDAMVDFRVLYYPARCLLHHGDPYNSTELLRMTVAETGNRPEEVTKAREVMRYIYPPTAFALTVPIAMLPWGPAHFLWMALIIGSLIFASFLIWNLAADYAPLASGALIGFFLFNSVLLAVAGNMAGVAISLCAIAVWCFVRERFIPAGIVCLAIALAAKPHDTGLVWLYFLLAGGVYCKRALQALAVTVALSLPGMLWVCLRAPNWLHELQSNLLVDSVHGGTNDPGLASTGAHGLGMMVNLQTAIAPLWDNPRIYNTVTYLIFGALLLAWSISTIRFPSSPVRLWLALATVAPLSMLPFYHRQQDTLLLLLTVPACAMLCARGKINRRLALLVNLSLFVLTGDILWIILFGFINRVHMPATNSARQLLVAVQVFPIPLILLVTAVFYLWLYMRRDFAVVAPAAAQKPGPQASPQPGV